MSGTAILLLLSSCHVFAYDEIQSPQELNITVPTLGEVVLTWKGSPAPRNKRIVYKVNISTPEEMEDIETKNNNFTLSMIALHGGFTAHVATQIVDLHDDNSSKTSGLSKWVSNSLAPYSGVDGTAASNLSCHIDIETSGRCSLSCNWAPGDAAPADTEYNLYYRCDNVIERCQDYVTEPGGPRRTGCLILSNIISIENTNHILVHVNGTSKSLQIKAMEKKFLASNIEVIPPVQNLTLDVAGLHWIKPVQSLPDICFQYEVNIRSKRRNETITVIKSSYLSDKLQKLTNRQFIRVRAVGQETCWTKKCYSQWTDVIHIGEDVDRSDILSIIVSVCLIVACITVFLLFLRFWGNIFPQIPRPKNDLKEAFQNVQSQALMRCNSWDNEVIISYIEEIVESDKMYKMSSDYGHIGGYSTSNECKSL